MTVTPLLLCVAMRLSDGRQTKRDKSCHVSSLHVSSLDHWQTRLIILRGSANGNARLAGRAGGCPHRCLISNFGVNMNVSEDPYALQIIAFERQLFNSLRQKGKQKLRRIADFCCCRAHSKSQTNWHGSSGSAMVEMGGVEPPSESA